jgi:RWD domain
LDDAAKENNQFMKDQEIESMQSIYNEHEFVVYDNPDSSIIEATDEKELQALKKLIKLSLIPQADPTKFHIVDTAKDINLELRCLPPIEVFILLPESYPSNGAPLFMMANTLPSNTLFYS